MNGLPVLSLIVFTPLIGVLVLLFVPGTNLRLIRWVARPAQIRNSFVACADNSSSTKLDPAVIVPSSSDSISRLEITRRIGEGGVCA